MLVSGLLRDLGVVGLARTASCVPFFWALFYWEELAFLACVPSVSFLLHLVEAKARY